MTFYDIASHELKAPITVILSNSELLEGILPLESVTFEIGITMTEK